MQGHQYVALRSLTIQKSDGSEGQVNIGDLIPREVSDKWEAHAIRSLVNIGRMQLSSVLDQKTLPYVSKRAEENEMAAEEVAKRKPGRPRKDAE